MMTTRLMTVSTSEDAELVGRSLSGNRDAFGEIVARYQSLICSLAYSATGSLTHSEDLAQETFVTAWKQLKNLREPGKLRSWLCGIARNIINNWLRREGREPSHAAETLETVAESHAPEPLPHDQTMSREEEAILWRSIERIPQIYREPLVLFYREHHSIEKVSAALELSEDAVKQRLSRGRKLLHDEMLAFVEVALERTNPGKAFTIGVLAALPLFTISANAAVMGAAAAKGSATAKAAGLTGLAGAILGPLLGIFGSYMGYRMSMDTAESERERQFVRSFYGKLMAAVVGFNVIILITIFFARPLAKTQPTLFAAMIIGLAVAYVLVTVWVGMWMFRERKKLLQDMAEGRIQRTSTKRVKEYRSAWTLMGLPLIHMRIGGGVEAQRKPAKAWIAIGDTAIGMVFAFGGMAIAPISVGGCACGLIAFGGCSLGMLALGGCSIGFWSFGGLAFGWQAFGGCAIAWNAAMGGFAAAKDFALGGFAHATQANNRLAEEFIHPNGFFKYGAIALRYLVWMNLLWFIPMMLWWKTAKQNTVETARA